MGDGEGKGSGRHVAAKQGVLNGLRVREGEQSDVGNFGPVILLEQDPTLMRLVAIWRNVP